MNPPRESVYDFGLFRLDAAEHRLLHDGRPIALTPKLFDLLRVLVEHAGHLVDKETLLREVWSGTYVEEGNLSRGISVLRKTLGEDPAGSRYIETVPKRGYRFIAEVRVRPPAPAAAQRLAQDNERGDGSAPASDEARPSWRPGQLAQRVATALAVLVFAGVAAHVGRGRDVSTVATGPGASLHRQLTFTGKELTPTLSPDRTRIAYVTNESPDRRVIVQQIADGQRITIFHAPEAGSLRWSPDGARLLFWARGTGNDGVYVTSASGGDARRIAAGAFVAAWSPDASAIAIADFVARTIRILDPSGRISRTVALKDTRGWIADLDWAPTHGALAFATGDAQGRPAIFIVRTDGTAQSQLVAADEEVTAVRWAPGGDAIYYFRRVGQTTGLYKTEVRDGSAVASGSPLLSGLESDGSFSLSADARALVYARAPYAANLWLVEIPATPDSVPRIRPLTDGTSVADRPRVSPDGTSIAFNMGVGSRTNVYTMPTAGGAARQMTHFDALSLNGVWSTDGRSIAFASTEGGTPRLWIVTVDDGAARPVTEREMSSTFDVAWSPGQRPLYQQTGNRNFYVVDPESRQERLLIGDASPGWVGSPAYSPDGKTIALFRTRGGRAGLWTVDAMGSRERLVYGPAGSSDMVPMPIGWSPDGTGIVAVEGKRAANRGLSTPLGETLTDVRIVRVPATGGQPSLLARLPFEEVGGVAISPDGRWLVCSVYTSRSDVWMVERFDRAAK